MKKFIFLDIDGVLNSQNKIEKNKKYKHNQSNDIDPILVKVLNKLIKESDCEIVISSSWRVLGIDLLNSIFEEVGICKSIYGLIGYTRSDRGIDIKNYIYKNNIENYVVIDDDMCTIIGHIPNTRLCPIDFNIGISDINISRCVSILNGIEVSSDIQCICQLCTLEDLLNSNK